MAIYDTGDDDPGATGRNFAAMYSTDDAGPTDEDGLPAKAFGREQSDARRAAELNETFGFGDQLMMMPIEGPIGPVNVGSRVTVERFGDGTLKFFGPHHRDGKNRCGVALDGPTGINNGTIGVSE